MEATSRSDKGGRSGVFALQHASGEPTPGVTKLASAGAIGRIWLQKY
jgi:hypothetical protein